MLMQSAVLCRPASRGQNDSMIRFSTFETKGWWENNVTLFCSLEILEIKVSALLLCEIVQH